MADSKITALDNLTTADPANDMIPIVDVSATPPASGNTKRISINNLLACSPSATLASATITGDLTVRTNKLFVNATGVGIGTTTVNGDLTIQNGSNCRMEVSSSATGIVIENLNNARNAYLNMTMYADAYIWNRLGSEAMRLNSTGLGVGVTPSAWLAAVKAIDIGSNALAAYSGGITHNAYFDNTDSRWEYKGTGAATFYSVQGGLHSWYVAASGTANTAITTFSSAAMTLDASGNLLVGTTSALSAWATRLTLSTDAGTTKWAVGPYADPNNFIISASGSFGVYLNGTSAVSWTGISDERLKDIIEPISNAVAKVGQLRSVIGKFKADETNTRRSFLLAQDVQAVLPEAVDASNPDRLGVAYTDVIPLLVAAIKELAAEVNALKNA
jgi:hypothetical protein